MSSDAARETALNEAAAWSRHLIGVEPGSGLAERYADGVAKLLSEEPPSAEQRVLEFARNHAWAVGLLDAGSIRMGGRGALTKRLLILTAVLEASPAHAADFLPVRRGRVALLARLAATVVLGALKSVVGMALYFMVAQPWRK